MNAACLPRTLAAMLFALGCATWADIAMADTAFDPGVLQRLGIDPKTADYFRQAPRFTPGENIVSLKINGIPKGRVAARFDANGALCITSGLLRAAGLTVPATSRADASDANACLDYLAAYPSTVIELRPGDNAIEMIVPAQALVPLTPQHTVYTAGGYAGVLNYDLTGLTRLGAGNHGGAYWQSNIELGVNAGNWIMRSRQTAASDNGHARWSHQHAYLQRTFPEVRGVFQAGQINATGALFALGTLYGAQWFPEQALTRNTGSGAVVDGIARSQARVEVHQLGARIASTLVPPGPFSLTDLPLLNANADLQVVIHEADGTTQRFTVPAASFDRGPLGAAPGLSVTIGRLRHRGNRPAPWVVTGARGWALGKRANLSTGALVSSHYQAVAANLDTAPLWGIAASTRLLASRSHGTLHGLQTSLALDTRWSQQWHIGMSATRRTAGYRELGNTLWMPVDRAHRGFDQYTLGLSWNHETLGMFSISHAHLRPALGHPTKRFVASWSRSFGGISALVNVAHNIGVHTRDSQFYLSLSIPLGKRNLSTSANRINGAWRQGLRYSDSIGPARSYSISAETDTANRTVSGGATLGATTRHAQLSLAANINNHARTSASANLRGGVVFHDDGITFSPYPIRDTFGLISLGDLSGVRIQTPTGPVWTDGRGRAVAASLPEYRSARIEVATQTLPRQVDLDNGVHLIEAGRGSVNRVAFAVSTVRRVLLDVKLPNGNPVPKAAGVLAGPDTLVAMTGERGQVFLSDIPNQPLSVVLADRKTCRIHYTLPETTAPGSYYERADAVCVPDDTVDDMRS